MSNLFVFITGFFNTSFCISIPLSAIRIAKKFDLELNFPFIIGEFAISYVLMAIKIVIIIIIIIIIIIFIMSVY